MPPLPQSSAAPSAGAGSPSPGGDGHALVQRALASVRSILSRNPALKYQVPLLLLCLPLLWRRVIRTRRALMRARPASFVLSSAWPPHAAPASSLPHPLWPTQLLYSLLRPVRLVQHALLRDSGAFGLAADGGALVAGALTFGWRPRILKAFMGWGEEHPAQGREWGVRYGPASHQGMDVYCTHRCDAATASPSSSSSSPLPLSPVIVFVHGGAWGSGFRQLYRLLALQLDRQLRCVVMVPSYRTYPRADVEGQMEDVATAVRFAAKNAHKWGGDASRIILAGHSSGSHVSSLLMLRSLQQEGAPLSSPSVARFAIPPLYAFIGLAGVYDIEDHYHFEAARGVHEISPMQPANGGRPQFASFSSTLRAASLTPAQRRRLPPVLLLHGLSDSTVPYAQSVRFAFALAGALPRQEELPLDPSCTPRAVPLPPLESHALYHAVEAPGQCRSAERVEGGEVEWTGRVLAGSSLMFLPPRALQRDSVATATVASTAAAASASAASSFPPAPATASDPVPSGSASSSPCPCPLVHLRMCGARTDPALQDHASALLDLMTYAEPVTKGATEAAAAASAGASASGPVADGNGHSRWVREAIQAFLVAVEAQKANSMTQVDSAPTVAAAATQPAAAAAIVEAADVAPTPTRLQSHL